MSQLLYIPCASLREEDVQSLIRLCLSNDVRRVDTHGGRQVAIKYLLNMHSAGYDVSKYVDLNKLKELEVELDRLKRIDLFKKDFDENHDDTFEPYWELNSKSARIHSVAKNARQFTNKKQFSPEQLKVYFNSYQIDNLAYSKATFESSGFVDSDARNNIIQYPFRQRQNKGQIKTKKGRIESAIFDVPSGKQIIVLDFADERMPGGLFLYGANTQEETICYHSNTYRALMDLKYNRFDGGFFIPEFGCLYIKNVEFYKPPTYNEFRSIDIVAAACYDLTGEHGLHRRPNSDEHVQQNTKKKLEAIIASAIANTEGSGENTYIILGPIGCGAFQNNLEHIAKMWADVLFAPLNEELKTQQRHAFEHIWFLSGTDNKLQVFEKYLQLSPDQRLVK